MSYSRMDAYTGAPSHDANNESLNNLIYELDQVKSAYKLLVGDFNFGSICWEDGIATSTTESTFVNTLQAQSLATNSPALLPRPLTCGVSSECLGTRSYETTSRDQRGKIEMFFSSTGACTAAKFPIANHYSQINTQLYSASLIRHIWQQRYSDSEFDAL